MEQLKRLILKVSKLGDTYRWVGRLEPEGKDFWSQTEKTGFSGQQEVIYILQQEINEENISEKLFWQQKK